MTGNQTEIILHVTDLLAVLMYTARLTSQLQPMPEMNISMNDLLVLLSAISMTGLTYEPPNISVE